MSLREEDKRSAPDFIREAGRMLKMMSTSTTKPNETARPKNYFATTDWAVVLAAGGSDSSASTHALEKLCRAYWYPLYAYVRRRGYGPEDSEDLTQEFFARLLEHNWVPLAHRSRGRFRSFLLMVLNRFLANEWDKIRAQKRGGGLRTVPFQMETAETRYSQEPAITTTPEVLFERQWALTLLEEVLSTLRAEYEEGGKVELFDSLKPCLLGRSETKPYAQLATSLGMSEAAVKVAVHRLRERYRARLKQEVAKTVAAPSEVDSELRHLFRVLAYG